MQEKTRVKLSATTINNIDKQIVAKIIKLQRSCSTLIQTNQLKHKSAKIFIDSD